MIIIIIIFFCHYVQAVYNLKCDHPNLEKILELHTE